METRENRKIESQVSISGTKDVNVIIDDVTEAAEGICCETYAVLHHGMEKIEFERDGGSLE